jgi:hypothetical protein
MGSGQVRALDRRAGGIVLGAVALEGRLTGEPLTAAKACRRLLGWLDPSP